MDPQFDDAGAGLLLFRQLPVLALDDIVVNGKDEKDDDTGGDAEDAACRHDDREEDKHVESPRHVLRQLRDRLEIKFCYNETVTPFYNIYVQLYSLKGFAVYKVDYRR